MSNQLTAEALQTAGRMLCESPYNHPVYYIPHEQYDALSLADQLKFDADERFILIANHPIRKAK